MSWLDPPRSCTQTDCSLTSPRLGPATGNQLRPSVRCYVDQPRHNRERTTQVKGIYLEHCYRRPTQVPHLIKLHLIAKGRLVIKTLVERIAHASAERIPLSSGRSH